jgi:hypothetical protein
MSIELTKMSVFPRTSCKRISAYSMRNFSSTKVLMWNCDREACVC